MASRQTPKLRLTPLGIVATFVTLTEAIFRFALTQVSGGVQVALTVFLIAYAIMATDAFFLILWFRPYVFVRLLSLEILTLQLRRTHRPPSKPCHGDLNLYPG
jgi:hypothetical protein